MSTRLTVFITMILCFFVGASFSFAQTLSVSPSKKTLQVEDQVSVQVIASSPDQAMNAVSASLSFPATLVVAGIDRSGSVIDFWTEEPHVVGGKIVFEGITLNPGYQGPGATLFTINFKAKKEGSATLTFNNAAILANDGLGSNILKGIGNGTFTIRAPGSPLVEEKGEVDVAIARAPALPVIVDYSSLADAKKGLYLKGKGEPGAITKIVFRDTSFRSIGEQFIASLQSKRTGLDEALVKNNPDDGTFEYLSPPGLIAGAYNATPFLVDEKSNAEKPGLGVQLFVSDSYLVRGLVVLVNVLALLIPIVGLVVLIYFIPWYSFRRMRIIKRRLGLEEEKLELSSHELKREDSVMEHTTNTLLSSSETPKNMV